MPAVPFEAITRSTHRRAIWLLHEDVAPHALWHSRNG
jgi:hypothetical protein